jgi:hypothetical protein
MQTDSGGEGPLAGGKAGGGGGAAAAPAVARSPLERLLAQLVVVQQALHEEAGGRGEPFDLRRHVPGGPSDGDGRGGAQAAAG